MTLSKRWSSKIAFFIVGLLSILFAPSSAISSEPFIAGFDRFHNDTSNDTIVGQLLLTELNCTACHAAGKDLNPKGGPSLIGVGDRFHQKWVEEYLRSPSSKKNGGTMPHMLHLVPKKIATLPFKPYWPSFHRSRLLNPKSRPLAEIQWLMNLVKRRWNTRPHTLSSNRLRRLSCDR